MKWGHSYDLELNEKLKSLHCTKIFWTGPCVIFFSMNNIFSACNMKKCFSASRIAFDIPLVLAGYKVQNFSKLFYLLTEL